MLHSLPPMVVVGLASVCVDDNVLVVVVPCENERNRVKRVASTRLLEQCIVKSDAATSAAEMAFSLVTRVHIFDFWRDERFSFRLFVRQATCLKAKVPRGGNFCDAVH